MTLPGLPARLALAGATLAGALVVVEVAAPLVLPARCGRGAPPFWRPVRDIGWVLMPNTRGETVVCEAGGETTRHEIVINPDGYRDRPRSRARGARPRVLVLGDSFVEALQVKLEETFTALLEDRLGVEVLNAGVSGYSTDNEVRAFVTNGTRYEPDAVLALVYVGNDVLENGPRLYLTSRRGLPPKPWLHADGAGAFLAGCLAAHRAAARVADATPTWLWSHSRVVRFALIPATNGVLATACTAAAGPTVVDGGPEALGVYGNPSTPGWVEGWATTERLLVELAGRVRDAGADFAVALAPAGMEYDPTLRVHEALFPATRTVVWDYDHPYRRFAEILDRHGIMWTSLRGALEAHYRTTGRSGYYTWDSHWTPEGHRVVAAALEPFVRRLLER